MMYRFDFPLTRYMSSISFTGTDKLMESARAEALWHYNRAREHDGLAPVKQLPAGTRVVRIETVGQ